MKSVFILLIPFFFSCQRASETNRPDLNEIPVIDTTPRVTGIGGVFFYADQPSSTKNWYADQLGITTDDYGAVFEFRNANRPNEINYLRWSLFSDTIRFMAPSEKKFMINYRVNNLRGLVRKLKTSNVNILDTIETYNYGSFIHIMDPEGNKIELWEPIDRALSKLGGHTTK